MKNTQPRLTISESAITLSELEKFAEGWFLSGEISQHSERTLSNRRDIVKKLLWFLKQQEAISCGVNELRAFLVYLTNGHKDPNGRWGNSRNTTPVKPRTVRDYHGHIRTLFRWIVAEGGLETSPMERIPIPVDRPDTIQPFDDHQVEALLTVAKHTRTARRDEAILLFLLDTGVRASELCDLRFRDLDMTRRAATVEGKGGKSRPVYFGKRTAKALWTYLRDDGRGAEEAVFLTEQGETMNRNTLLQLIRRLGKQAGIVAARCSPHNFRHTFAVSFLRNGGNQFSLMRLLGHTHVHQTSRYVAIAQADVETQARQFSPADNLKRGGKR